MTRLQESPAVADIDTFERRWEAWRAEGRARDARIRIRARVVVTLAVIIGTTAGLWWIAVA
jgi:hypothetical protein